MAQQTGSTYFWACTSCVHSESQSRPIIWRRINSTTLLRLLLLWLTTSTQNLNGLTFQWGNSKLRCIRLNELWKKLGEKHPSKFLTAAVSSSLTLWGLMLIFQGFWDRLLKAQKSPPRLSGRGFRANQQQWQGRGSGSVGWVVASCNQGPRFESHQQHFGSSVSFYLLLFKPNSQHLFIWDKKLHLFQICLFWF